jgi:hypothetical protein
VVDAKPGDNVTLPCNVQGSVSRYTWYINSASPHKVASTHYKSGYEFYKHLRGNETPRAHIDLDTGALTIFSVIKTDEYPYICQADGLRKTEYLLNINELQGNLFYLSFTH